MPSGLVSPDDPNPRNPIKPRYFTDSCSEPEIQLPARFASRRFPFLQSLNTGERNEVQKFASFTHPHPAEYLDHTLTIRVNRWELIVAINETDPARSCEIRGQHGEHARPVFAWLWEQPRRRVAAARPPSGPPAGLLCAWATGRCRGTRHMVCAHEPGYNIYGASSSTATPGGLAKY